VSILYQLHTKTSYSFFTQHNGTCRCINEEPYGNENMARFIEQSVITASTIPAIAKTIAALTDPIGWGCLLAATARYFLSKVLKDDVLQRNIQTLLVERLQRMHQKFLPQKPY